MRVGLVTTFYPPYHFGGDAVYAYRLARALAGRGHAVEVVHNVDAFRLLSTGPPAEGFPDQPGVRVHRLASRLGRLELLTMQQTGRSWLHRRRLREILENRRFDVIHFHNVSLMGGPAVLRLGAAIKLYTLHEHWLVCPMHVLWRYGREVCEKRTCIRCQLVGWRPPQWWRYTALLKRSLRSIDAFIAPSLFVLRKHRELGLDLPVRHIPHFVVPPPEDAVAGPRGEAAPEGDFFLFAGRVEPAKGAGALVRVFRRYRKAGLVIAGDGGQRARLEAEARDLPHVRFVGRLTPRELAVFYRRAIGVIVPSACHEVFGLTAAEAFAVGTPAIVRDRGALPELIEATGGGFVFRTEDELLDRMERLRAAPALRGRLGALARAVQRKVLA
ncbi:MAG: glycosyltransferase, partial [Planctomycetota bacterium]